MTALLTPTTPPDTTTDPNHYYGTEIQGIAAGMWSTMPEWARIGVCVILVSVLLTGIVHFFSTVIFRVIGVVVAACIVAVFFGTMPALYEWFRHLPFINGEV